MFGLLQVPRYGKGEEEDALLVQLRRSQEVSRRRAQVHPGDGHRRGQRGGRRREAQIDRSCLGLI